MALRVKIIGKDGLSGKLSKIGGRVVGLGKKFTKFGILAGGVLAGASMKVATDFDKGIREVTTLMDNVTDSTIPNMVKELKKLATVSGDSLKSLTKAKYDIVSAGFGEAAESAQVLVASTKLAIGGVTDTAKAADLLTTALNAYQLEASDVDEVSDMMFMTVKMGKTTMDQLAESLGQVLPFAKAGKMALDDVGASMAIMTASGL
ncbi:MAG: phage tail tape measure protein, partial [Anaerolineales bacterium]|nr:phage tail tape measure protein [Anaerolineales bacterium]